MPAATSSITMPAPPLNRCSIVRMGNGLVMSSKRNKTKPKATFKTVKGRPTRATISPQISSMTIIPGSFCCNRFSAWPAIHTEAAMSAANMIRITGHGRRAISQHTGKPANVPKVPGAKGMYPRPQPLERNSIARLRIVMARLYSLD